MKKKSVYIHELKDTSVISFDPDVGGIALLDSLQEETEVGAGKCTILRWTTKSFRDHKPSSIFILKVWVTPFKTRKIRLQCHKIRTDGTMGGREIIWERHNGVDV